MSSNILELQKRYEKQLNELVNQLEINSTIERSTLEQIVTEYKNKRAKIKKEIEETKMIIEGLIGLDYFKSLKERKENGNK